MKKIIITIMAILLLITFSACGNKSTPAVGSDNSNKDTATQSKDKGSEKDSLEEALDNEMASLEMKKTTWPKEIVQTDMPEYKAGKFKGWNKWDNNNDNIFILIDETSKEDLEKYIVELKTAGFKELNRDTYQKGPYTIGLQFNGEKILQISSSKEKTLEWPKALLEGVPQPKNGLLTGVTEPSTEVPDAVQLYLIDFNKDDVVAWLKDMETAGFKVEGEFATKENMKLKGKSYKSMSVQLQENGTEQWIVDFSYSE